MGRIEITTPSPLVGVVGLRAAQDRRVGPALGRAFDSRYISEVDAIRGLAVTGVIAIHCGILPFGWMGVWLFYVVSGFAVASSLFGSHQRSGQSAGSTIRHFYVRRALRIWPLYFLFLGTNFAYLLMSGKLLHSSDVAALLTFTYNMKMISDAYAGVEGWPAFGHLWTLSVEQQFYLAFPFIVLLGNFRAKVLALVMAIALAPVIRAAVSLWAAGAGGDNSVNAFAIYAFGPAHFDAFAAGALVTMFRNEIAAHPRCARYAIGVAGVICAAYIGVYLAIGINSSGSLTVNSLRNIVSGILFGQGREVFLYLVPTSVGVAVLMGILARAKWCMQVCRLPGLQAVGRISYGGYLLHLPVLMVLHATSSFFSAGFAGHIMLFATALPLTVGLAWLSYHYFEAAFSRIKLRYA